MINVLSSGSSGNAVIYHGFILMDCGVPFSTLKPYIKDLKIVLLTHSHGDHFNISTIKRLAFERPTLRFGCGGWMVPLLDGVKNVDVYDFGKWYDYGAFKVAIGKLYHDVPNCLYRLEKDGIKIFHATDSSTLAGITAKDYNLYAIEANYNEDTVYDVIQRIESQGGYAHQRGSINSHLSEQQAQDFVFKNGNKNSLFVRLHESKTAI